VETDIAGGTHGEQRDPHVATDVLSTQLDPHAW
jgi:hypothetical protein